MGNSSTKTVLPLLLFMAGLLLCNPFIANAFKINLQLTGDVNFPGVLKIDAGMAKKFDRLCFLGQDALGMIDLSFLETLAGDFFWRLLESFFKSRLSQCQVKMLFVIQARQVTDVGAEYSRLHKEVKITQKLHL